MAIRPKEAKLVARITALEILVQHLLVMVACAKADPIAQLAAYRERVLAEHSEGTISGTDAATSDLLTQELTEALDAVLSQALARAQGNRPSKQGRRDPSERPRS